MTSRPAHIRALKDLLATGGAQGILQLPGCWNGLSALLVENAGFEAAFLSGAALSMSRLGRPDLGFVDFSELLAAMDVVRDRVDLPILVDADTGFGNTLNTRRTVRMLERRGASAIQIEDQTSPKRCGHLTGKDVIPAGEAVDKIKAALDTREHALISARTDAAAVLGLTEAIERGLKFAEAGADLVFVEGPRTLDEANEIVRQLGSRVPLVCNLVNGGPSCFRNGAEAREHGFGVALHPLLLLEGFVFEAKEWLGVLRSEMTSASIRDRLLDLGRLNDVLGLDALIGTEGPVAEEKP